jgi:hypothetical protein
MALPWHSPLFLLSLALNGIDNDLTTIILAVGLAVGFLAIR